MKVIKTLKNYKSKNKSNVFDSVTSTYTLYDTEKDGIVLSVFLFQQILFKLIFFFLIGHERYKLKYKKQKV